MEKNTVIVLAVAMDQLKDAAEELRKDRPAEHKINRALKFAKRAVESLELAKLWEDV